MQTILELPRVLSLFKTSWQAAVLILLVLAAQWAFGRRLGPRWRYALWLLVIARLAVPLTVPSPVSLFNVLKAPKPEAAAQMASAGAGVSGWDRVRPTAVVPEEASLPPAARAVAPAESAVHGWVSWLLPIWAAGALALGVFLALSHYRILGVIAPCRPLIDATVMNLLEDCKERMQIRTPVTLLETAHVGSPALLGFIRPRLLLPVGLRRSFSLEELRFIFLHELGHLKRHDILTAWVMTGLQILHWFNPLVWLAFHRMRVDRELACDALALSYARENDNQPYGRTIIKLLEGFGVSAWAPGLAGTLENRNQLQERIGMIARFNKTNRGPVLALALLTSLGLITLTDARSGESSPAQTADAPPTPNIISTFPAVGATNVDPAVAQIEVTFDQDMGGGMSWTGGGPDFPASPEGQKAQWRNKRTCVLPVKLETGHYYRVGINSTSYQNFANAHGVAALPSAIFFTTLGAGEDLKAKVRLPKIVSLNPPNGARNVSATLTQLQVTFDVPMNDGFSWTGGGPTFPKGPEGQRPSWSADHLTCTLPVKLTPDTTYSLGLNSRRHINFQSASGVPLEPVQYTFTTAH